MALKLFGHKMSLCTQRVLLVLAEKEVDFEFKDVDFLHGEHKQAAYVQKHPFGVIPLLEDGDFTLYESRAIGRYIASKFHGQGTPLIPTGGDIKEWAIFEQWNSVEYSQLFEVAIQVLYLKMFNPMKGTNASEDSIAQSVRRLHEKLAVLDKVLGDQRYLGGQSFSLVDIFFMPTMNLLQQVEGQFINDLPNIKNWWETVTSRKSWKQVTSG